MKELISKLSRLAEKLEFGHMADLSDVESVEAAADALQSYQWNTMESAPKDGTWILGYRDRKNKEDSVEVWAWNERQGYWVNAADHNDFDEFPTAWMPLPPPTEGV